MGSGPAEPPATFHILGRGAAAAPEPSAPLSAITGFDSALSDARVVSGAGTPGDPWLLEVAGGRARIAFDDRPHPADADLEAAIAWAHYGAELKEAARGHGSHVEIALVTENADPLERYALLAGIAGALAGPDALVVVHKAAHASLPAAALRAEPGAGGRLATIRALPIPLLFCGFVKLEVEDEPGVWMRTWRADLVGLPDFAAHVSGHDWGERVLDTISALYRHLTRTGTKFRPGDTATVSPGVTLAFQAPDPDLEFLAARGELLVLVFP
jgi:hypothetical protein